MSEHLGQGGATDHPFDLRFQEHPTTRLGDVLSPILGAKLDAMTLRDDTGDAYDEGYMAAVDELRDWMEHGDET